MQPTLPSTFAFVIITIFMVCLVVVDAAPQSRPRTETVVETQTDNWINTGRSPAEAQMCLEARVSCKTVPPPSAIICLRVPPSRPGLGQCCMELACLESNGEVKKHWGWSTTSFAQTSKKISYEDHLQSSSSSSCSVEEEDED